MYWILSCMPLIVELILNIYSLRCEALTYNSTLNILMWFWILILRQIYLLCVNIIYIHKRVITYKMGAITMFSTIVISVMLLLLFHKIQYGVFIGDVPEGIYYLLIGIPTMIILIGMAIMYFFRK